MKPRLREGMGLAKSRNVSVCKQSKQDESQHGMLFVINLKAVNVHFHFGLLDGVPFFLFL